MYKTQDMFRDVQKTMKRDGREAKQAKTQDLPEKGWRWRYDRGRMVRLPFIISWPFANMCRLTYYEVGSSAKWPTQVFRGLCSPAATVDNQDILRNAPPYPTVIVAIEGVKSIFESA